MLKNLRFEKNKADQASGCININENRGEIQIQNVKVTENQSDEQGAGI